MQPSSTPETQDATECHCLQYESNHSISTYQIIIIKTHLPCDSLQNPLKNVILDNLKCLRLK